MSSYVPCAVGASEHQSADAAQQDRGVEPFRLIDSRTTGGGLKLWMPNGFQSTPLVIHPTCEVLHAALALSEKLNTFTQKPEERL